MTKIVIRCIAAVTFVAFALPCSAQDPYNFAQDWRTWSKSARLAYLQGFREGSFYASALTATFFVNGNETARNRLHSEEFTEMRKRTVLDFRPSTLEPIISEFYADPANASILLQKAAFIAADKLRGNDVTNAILEARKEAIEIHEMERKAKP